MFQLFSIYCTNKSVLRRCVFIITIKCIIDLVECKKTIEVSAARDHEQELYCKTCYGRLFGPKGYGFAGGAGTMLSMDAGKDGDVTTRLVDLESYYISDCRAS